MGRKSCYMGADRKRKCPPEHGGSGKNKEILQDKNTCILRGALVQYIYKHEDDLATAARIDREHRKFVRRQEALKDRMSHTAKLPEKRILEYADRIYFQKEHHLYYKKYGSWTKIACSKCGGVTDARWRDGISYESQFQKHTEEPREGKSGKCPMCGAVGTYKCQGKIKGEYSKKINLFLGQRYKEDGAVLRYVEIEKAWTLGFIKGNDGPEMYNAAEELSGVEVARAYFEPGKRCRSTTTNTTGTGTRIFGTTAIYTDLPILTSRRRRLCRKPTKS